MTAAASRASGSSDQRGRGSRAMPRHSRSSIGESAWSRGEGSISAGSSRRVVSAATSRPAMVNTANWRRPSTPENRKVT
ncbi:hypothetical protein NB705_003837 [Xanthomonas sacchari]|nr:hypothetical protein [Xanthomonas sacchari]